MSDPQLFTLRPLARQATSATLDGAFRVHVSSRDLKTLSLEPGELCRLTVPDGPSMLAFAWLSQDGNANNPKPIAKITDTLKDAYNLNFQDKVLIERAENSLLRADKVYVTEVGPATLSGNREELSELEYWAGQSLSRLEAIVPGGTVDVVPRRGHLRAPKRRFLVEKIEPPRAHVEPTEFLYFFDYKSKVMILDASALAVSGKTQSRHFAIDSEGVGGLSKQLQQLGKRLDAFNFDLRRSSIPAGFRRSGAVLIYGPEGTGKSLLLKKLAQAPWDRVFTVDESILSQYVGQSQIALRKLFSDALKHQPSLVVIDQLDAVAGKHDGEHPWVGGLASSLATELEKTKDAQVLVVAATSCIEAIDKSLRTPSRFRYEIEIPVPDANARIEILKILQQKDRSAPDALSENIGERTHGFVGSDLEALYENALEKAVDRFLGHTELMRHKTNGNVNPVLDEAASGRTRTNGSSETTLSIEITQADFESALLEVRPTAMKEVFLETPKVKWTDIGGSEKIQKALYKVTERPFKRPDLIRDLDLEPQKGILLYGPPGCSKTLTAKAVATEAGLNFIAVKGAELTSMYVGESERAIREIFRKARAASPSIIFFDEIDSIGASRDSASGSKHAASGLNVLTTLLNEMDGIESLKGVLVLAATNKPEILDPALMRPGRFDTLFYIGPPNVEARKQILDIRTRKMPLANDVDLTELAEMTEGYSGAELVRICAEAAEATADDRERNNSMEKIRGVHFMLAMKKVVRQLTPEMIARYEQWTVGGLARLDTP